MRCDRVLRSEDHSFAGFASIKEHVRNDREQISWICKRGQDTVLPDAMVKRVRLALYPAERSTVSNSRQNKTKRTPLI
jgi:hypothetical protein